MPATIPCPECDARLKVPDGAAGRRIRCPRCGTTLTVPGTNSISAAAPKRSPPGDDDEDDTAPEDRPQRRKRKKKRSPAGGMALPLALGLGAVAVGCIAFGVAFIPDAGIISIIAGGLGIVAGGVGVVFAITSQRGLPLPIAGSATSAVALVFAIIWMGNRGTPEIVNKTPPAANSNVDRRPVNGGGAGIATAGHRRQSANNLRQLALAMHIFHDVFGHLPHAATNGKNGKGQLSWRVALLPYVEEGPLFAGFRHNEAWDSPHNMALLTRMPKVYESPYNTAPTGMTYYQVFTGKGPFGRPNPMRMTSFTDGTANTLLIVEAGKPVPWTKPDDLFFDGKTLPDLRGPYGDGIYVTTADGATRFLSRTVPEDVLRKAITPDGGEFVQLPD